MVVFPQFFSFLRNTIFESNFMHPFNETRPAANVSLCVTSVLSGSGNRTIWHETYSPVCSVILERLRLRAAISLAPQSLQIHHCLKETRALQTSVQIRFIILNQGNSKYKHVHNYMCMTKDCLSIFQLHCAFTQQRQTSPIGQWTFTASLKAR